jgi:hypothetical protein
MAPIRTCLAAALCVLPLQAWADAPAMKLDYDVYAGGIFLVSGGMTLDLDSDRYKASVEAKGGRLIDLLSRWSYRASADGRVEGGAKVEPERFQSDRQTRSRHRKLSMGYDKAGNVSVTAEPPQSDLSANAVSPEFRPNTLDPVSAAVGVIAASGQTGCSGTFPVFDGRRRYDVIVTSNGPDTLEKSSRNMHQGAAEKCTIRIHPVAGFERDREDGEFFQYGVDRTATAWFAEPMPGQARVPVRIQVDLDWINVVMNLVSANKA